MHRGCVFKKDICNHLFTAIQYKQACMFVRVDVNGCLGVSMLTVSLHVEAGAEWRQNPEELLRPGQSGGSIQRS